MLGLYRYILVSRKMRGKWRKAGVDKQTQPRCDVTEDLVIGFVADPLLDVVGEGVECGV
jgi:hypothetical protein